MAYIENADYETFSARCDHCQVVTLFNRVEIGRFTDLESTDLLCPACDRSFWATGDLANAPYQLFIWDADRSFSEKRYMLCVASLCHAWEVFLSTLARTIYLDRPFFKTSDEEQDLDVQNRLADLFTEVTEKFTFGPFRNLVIHTVLHDIAPSDQAQAKAAILRIRSEGFGNDVAPRRVEQYPDLRMRQLLEALQKVTVGQLRNKVLHQKAYRPTGAEANACRQAEVVLLYRLEQVFGVDDFRPLLPLGV